MGGKAIGSARTGSTAVAISHESFFYPKSLPITAQEDDQPGPRRFTISLRFLETVVSRSRRRKDCFYRISSRLTHLHW